MTPQEIEKRIEEILSDERLSYKTATVFVNAPLALIQNSLEVELHTLQRTISVPFTDIKKLRNERT